MPATTTPIQAKEISHPQPPESSDFDGAVVLPLVGDVTGDAVAVGDGVAEEVRVGVGLGDGVLVCVGWALCVLAGFGFAVCVLVGAEVGAGWGLGDTWEPDVCDE